MMPLTETFNSPDLIPHFYVGSSAGAVEFQRFTGLGIDISETPEGQTIEIKYGLKVFDSNEPTAHILSNKVTCYRDKQTNTVEFEIPNIDPLNASDTNLSPMFLFQNLVIAQSLFSAFGMYVKDDPIANNVVGRISNELYFDSMYGIGIEIDTIVNNETFRFSIESTIQGHFSMKLTAGEFNNLNNPQKCAALHIALYLYSEAVKQIMANSLQNSDSGLSLA